MLRRWPILNKLLCKLAMLMVIVGLLSWSGIYGLYCYRALTKDLERRMNELPAAAELSKGAGELRLVLCEVRADGENRALAPAGQNTFRFLMFAHREAFRRHYSQTKRSLEEYRKRIATTHWDGLRIGDGRQEWQAIREMEAILGNIERVDRDEDWMLDQVRVDRIESQVDRLQHLSLTLQGFLYHDVHGFLERVKDQYRALMVVAWVAAALTVVSLLLLGWMAYLWIFRPLRILVKGSRKVAAGQFNHRVKLDSNDEMQELADAMNAMTDGFREVRDDLDRQVQERTRQLIRNEQLAGVGFLAAGVSHEINNPLASIVLCADAIRDRLAEAWPEGHPELEVAQEYIKVIHDEAFRAKGITERLLDLSRQGDVKRQPTPLRELVQSVIDTIEQVGRYPHKSLSLAPGEERFVEANAQQMKQVVLNLLSNALDSVDDEGSVVVAILERGENVELVVRDDGCGMDEEVLEHLFEPFFTRKRPGIQGTGLGLSITHRIIRDHGGEITASSPGVGQGSEFRVKLPALSPISKEPSHQHAQLAA